MLYKLTWEKTLERHANASEAHRDFGHDPDYAPLDFNAFSYSYLDLEDDGIDRPQTNFYKLTNGEMR